MRLSDVFKTLAWVLGGATISTLDRMTKATTWQELNSPWFVLTFVGSAFMFLTAYWSKSPVPVAGEPTANHPIPQDQSPSHPEVSDSDPSRSQP
jgi:hypothetical protein